MAYVSIVVPVYHNASSLPNLLDRFRNLADLNSSDRFEFIFVEDGSRDNSFEVLDTLAHTEPRMRIVKLSRNFGSNAAVLAGLSHARGDAVAAIAADLQDPPELIHEMLAQWRAGHKVVLATRRTRDDPGLTAVISDIFYWLFRRYAIGAMPRRGFDFFLIDYQVCELITRIQENNAYLMGLILWMGFDRAIVPYDRVKRNSEYGRSMWSFTRKVKYFIDAFAAFSFVPVRAASVVGFLVATAGLIYALVVIIARVFFDFPVEGWASLMVVVLLASGTQMIMLGILGEYLWRTLDETRRRPQYIVERILEAADDAQR